MSIEFRKAESNTANSAGGAGSMDIDGPDNRVDGDWMIAAVVSPLIISPPSGWTELYRNDTGGTRGVWYKLCASESGDYTFTWPAGSASGRVVVGAIVCYKQGSAVVPTVGAATIATSASVTGASVTIPYGAGALLLIGLEHVTLEEATITTTPPAGMIERVDVNRTTGASDDSHGSVSIHEVRNIVPGASGAKVATLSASKNNTGILVTLYQAGLTYGAVPAPVETLVELDVWDVDLAAVVTKKYSSRGMIYPGNEFYEARVMNRLVVSQSAFDGIGGGGAAALTAGDIELWNGDNALDSIAARNLALGRPVLIKTMPAPDQNASDCGGGAISGATTMFTGTVAVLNSRARESQFALVSRRSSPVMRPSRSFGRGH